jgi:hypothetical protein
MKTIKQHFETLEYPYREQALRNTSYEALIQEKESLLEALLSAFLWEKSPEGFKFWDDLSLEISNN